MDSSLPNLNKKENTMPKKTKVNEKALLKMIQEGAAQPAIMEKFGFKNSSQLKVAYANALMNAGQVPELKTARKAAAAPEKKVVVGKRGSLVISKALVESLGLKEGDGFVVRKTKAGLSLKKAD
jgi:hypothetical protein